jgi:hypothetical protein
MKGYHEAFALIKSNRVTFSIINIAYFAIIVFGMVAIRSNPEMQRQLTDMVGTAFSTGPMQFITGAYSNGEIINAIAFTFFINLVLGCFIAITLPSFIIPYSGFLVGGLRAILWGFLFSPDLTELSFLKILAGIGMGLLLIFEGEAYVLGLFTSFLHGRAWLAPSSVGAEHVSQGYQVGLKLTFRMYLLIITMLLIAAVYEAILAIIILPALL